MTTEIMLWQVTEGKLAKLPKRDFASTHKEKDLEEWVESDPSILGKDDLTIIGRQIYIPRVGPLDLLAVDQDGRLVVIEFKRQQTTRDTIAQVLDYASSIRLMDLNQLAGLSNININELNRVTEIDPSMILVAAGSDESVERIVEYMVSKAQLPIEVVTFTYATLADGQEVIARSILVPETSPQAQSGSTYMTLPDHLRMAIERKVDAMLMVLRQVMQLDMWEQVVPSRKSYLRYRIETLEGKENVLLSIDVVGERFKSPLGSLDLWLYPEIAAEYTGLSAEITWEQLEALDPIKKTSTMIYFRLTTVEAANKLYDLLCKWKTKNSESIAAAISIHGNTEDVQA